MVPSFDRDTRGWTAGLYWVLLLGCALFVLFAASASAAAPNWLEPSDLSKPGRDASNPAVAADAAGDTVALWERRSTAGPAIDLQTATRTPGAAFTAPIDLTTAAADPRLAMSPSGEAVVAWKHLESPPGLYTIQVATRPPGGSFSAPSTVYTAPPGNPFPQEVQIAIGSGGDVAVTWATLDPNAEFSQLTCATEEVEIGGEIIEVEIKCPNPYFVMGSVRPAGGVFTEPVRISPPRGTEETGESESEKEEREIAESAMAAGGARPVVDAAGNTTVVFSYFDGEDNVVESAVRPAGGSFAAPVQISESGEDAGSADIGIDSAGNAVATWARSEGTSRMVQAGIKPPGGSFASLGNVSPAGGTAERPVIGVTPSGSATVAWRLAGISESFVQSATRPPGGSFSSPASLSSGKDNPLFHEIAVGDEGDAIVVWSGDNGADEIVRAAVRPSGDGPFGAPVAISQSSFGLFHPHPAMDAGGNATVVWVRDNGTHNIVQMAGYDADPPQLRDIAIPAAGTVATPLQFSASSFDAWPVSQPGFDFGDGATAVGTSVSHAYSAPGTYTVKVATEDSVGKTATGTGTVLVKARNFFTIGKLSKNRKKGTATLTVIVPEPGAVAVSGRGIRKATARTAKAGAVRVPLKAVGKGLKGLNQKGKLKVRLKIAYSPTGGETSTRQRKVTLQKKLG